MMNKVLSLAAATLAMAVFAGAAHAGPHCKPGAASSYAPKASAVKQAQVPAKANVQRISAVSASAQGGGDVVVSAPVEPKKVAQATPRIDGPAVEAPANSDTGGEYTSVSGIAARLAALAAQEKAKGITAE